MKVLVTGGSGFVGSILVPEMLRKGYSVRVMDNLMYGQINLLECCIDPRFEFFNGDIRDLKAVEKAVEGVDAIIHLAAIVGAPACNKDLRVADEVNYRGTVNIDRARNPSQKLIFASTGSVYGAIEGICSEESELAPLTSYGVTKLKAEQQVLDSGNSIAFRFATGFGLAPRLRLDLMPNDFVFQALKNRAIIVYEKDFRRTFIHVRDMASVYIFALENYSRMVDDVYNVGSEKLNCTKEDIVLKIKEKIDFFLHFADFGADPDKRDYEVSYKKIRDKGFETMISLESGIAELIAGLGMINLRNPYSNVE